MNDDNETGDHEEDNEATDNDNEIQDETEWRQ